MHLGKRERRSYYRELQESFPAINYQNWNKDLGPKLVEAIQQVPEGSYVAVYQARAKEANLSPIFHLNYKFCFPKVLSRNGKMEFRHVPKPLKEENFSIGHFGILEPKTDFPLVDKKLIHAAFVPLLSFDNQGRRLGQGKGFYDRFLEGFSGMKIGAAFEWQFSLPPLPVETHDHLLDMVVTEHGIRRFNS